MEVCARCDNADGDDTRGVHSGKSLSVNDRNRSSVVRRAFTRIDLDQARIDASCRTQCTIPENRLQTERCVIDRLSVVDKWSLGISKVFAVGVIFRLECLACERCHFPRCPRRVGLVLETTTIRPFPASIARDPFDRGLFPMRQLYGDRRDLTLPARSEILGASETTPIGHVSELTLWPMV